MMATQSCLVILADCTLVISSSHCCLCMQSSMRYKLCLYNLNIIAISLGKHLVLFWDTKYSVAWAPTVQTQCQRSAFTQLLPGPHQLVPGRSWLPLALSYVEY